MEANKYSLFNTCKLVKASNVYFVYDLLRIRGYYVSLNVGNYLNNIQCVLSREDKKEIKNLLNNELIYLKEACVIHGNIVNIEKNRFPTLISNLIIEFNNELFDSKRIDVILKIISNLFIKNIQIQVDLIVDEQKLLNFIDCFNHSIVNHIEIIFTKKVNKILLKKLETNDRIQVVFLVQKQTEDLIINNKLYKIKDTLYLSGAHPVKFSIDKKLFDESQDFHNYFHKKMFIDCNGNLYNAPEYKRIFANVFENSDIENLVKIVKSSNYRKYWNVKKDICKVCKDCEYRYMCVDIRLPIKDKDGLWKHSIECNYNPYTKSWKKIINYGNKS